MSYVSVTQWLRMSVELLEGTYGGLSRHLIRNPLKMQAELIFMLEYYLHTGTMLIDHGLRVETNDSVAVAVFE